MKVEASIKYVNTSRGGGVFKSVCTIFDKGEGGSPNCDSLHLFQILTIYFMLFFDMIISP